MTSTKIGNQDSYSRALIIEDDKEIASVISMNLEDLGLKTTHALDGASGLDLALNETFAIIILDLMLPRLDGVSICKKVREQDPLTPIMMLTAKTGEIDRVLGLEIGADDYMTKPFSVREFIARVRALLRRSQIGNKIPEQEDALGVTIGELSVDFNKRKVFLSENEIELTVKEFELLSLFLKNPGRAYSRADLLNLVWGYQFEGYEHTVNTHINRLRNKIEDDPAKPQYLKTVWGIGYRFAENGEF